MNAILYILFTYFLSLAYVTTLFKKIQRDKPDIPVFKNKMATFWKMAHIPVVNTIFMLAHIVGTIEKLFSKKRKQ